MRAGRLDRQITIHKASRVKNAYGDWTEGFTALPAVPAGLKHLPGSERLTSAENAATAPTVFVIRWTPALDPNDPTGLNAKDRVEYPVGSGRLFDIHSAIELGRHDTIEIAAVVGTD